MRLSDLIINSSRRNRNLTAKFAVAQIEFNSMSKKFNFVWLGSN